MRVRTRGFHPDTTLLALLALLARAQAVTLHEAAHAGLGSVQAAMAQCSHQTRAAVSAKTLQRRFEVPRRCLPDIDPIYFGRVATIIAFSLSASAGGNYFSEKRKTKKYA